MELLQHIATGFAQAATTTNLLYALAGCLLGTLVGVLPGLGPVATVAMLLPATYALDPIPGLIMMAGIYYGAQYGGSTTAILIKLPGESSSLVTTLDGYAMTRQGKAGTALALAALGSFFAGCVGTFILAAFSPQLAKVAFHFGAPEYFSLMCLGLIGAIALSSGDVVKALAMTVLGLLLGMIGSDVTSGETRFTFGFLELEDGLEFAIVAMAWFGFGEIIWNLTQSDPSQHDTPQNVSRLRISWRDMKVALPAIFRGSAIGTLFGVLPGGGAVLASFASYTVEKKLGPKPGEPAFGEGNLRGLAGPESANNAGAQTNFIPMLTLGIPSGPVMALMIAALSVHDIQAGPQILTRNADLFWALVASMWIGNLMLLVLNYPLIGIWIRLLAIPYKWLFPAIVLFCTIGVYCISNSSFSILLLAFFILFGYAAKRLQFEGAPLMLGLILGANMEEYLRRSLTLSGGDWTVFLYRPLSATLLSLCGAMLLLMSLSSVKVKRRQVFADAEA
ncbi:tripartite tricarboxylate transporter permease [uncultured Pigmentiphaga sp.]|uniref:tripartite tricarboxylate transporter permease n=1 Tax=uncultured Pigmentiphaga sp. TaxID=340361 RepID=UPI00262AF426|nr:tripartite tricarboxylate transporter permease [uncultured Pigmentiphaga sp.]